MCDEVQPTPKDEQVPCSRCGKICNPTKQWEHGWPNHGYMKLGWNSCIDFALLRDVPAARGDDNPLRHAVIFGEHPLVKKYGAQCIELEWAAFPPLGRGEFAGQLVPVLAGHKRYRLCYDCQQKLLRMIGRFFFGESESEWYRVTYRRAGVTTEVEKLDLSATNMAEAATDAIMAIPHSALILKCELISEVVMALEMENDHS